MRRVLFTLLATLLPVLAFAQSPAISRPLTSATCPGSGCVTLSIQGMGAASIQVAGTYSGTVAFEVSTDGATFTALAMTPAAGGSTETSTTSTGAWSSWVGGYRAIRARVSSYSSGTANVSIGGALGLAAPGLSGVILGNGTQPATAVALSNNAAQYFNGVGAFSTPSASACGVDGQIQFNNSGACGGATGLTYNAATGLTYGVLLAGGSTNSDFYSNSVGSGWQLSATGSADQATTPNGFLAEVTTGGLEGFSGAVAGIFDSHDTGTVNALNSLNLDTIKVGSGTAGNMVGSSTYVWNQGDGAISGDMAGHVVSLESDDGTIGGNVIGIDIRHPTVTAVTGRVDGIYMSNQTVATGASNTAINVNNKFMVGPDGGYIAGVEGSVPAAPAANGYRLFAQDSGGKTQLCVRFNTGAVQCFATEP